jgi:hypothetical protein
MGRLPTRTIVEAKRANFVASEAPKPGFQMVLRPADGEKERRAVDHVCRTLPCPSAVECHVASSAGELSAAFNLVYQQYRRCGLMEANSAKMRVTPYHLLPTTEVLVAAQQGTVICTMSLVCDGKRLGLPMESVYPEEIATLRRRNLSLAEVSCLAEEPSSGERSQSAVFQLMPLMAQLAYRRGVDWLLIAVHPRHARFYRRFLGFDIIAEERDYGQVCGKPAVALAADLNNLAANHPRVHQWMFGTPFPGSVMEHKLLPTAILDEMRQVVDACYSGRSAPNQSRELAMQYLSCAPV